MSNRATQTLCIEVPDWVNETIERWAKPAQSDFERMELAVELSRLNVERGGGPFAALVFAGDDWLGAGVNRVVDSGFSIAHAEIVAMMSAQAQRRARLADVGRPLTLITTTEPCCQCFGALVWAGIERLVCGASTADAEAIGFDEGPKPANWVEVLAQRGVAVHREIGRDQAVRVHQLYVQHGGEIYGRSGLRLTPPERG
jgi:tRNA(Arg) A34 adenosine deaminase TadA